MTIATHISALCILAFYSLAEGQPSCRNKLVWPYASTSVWNTPIGSLADYQPANIFQGVEPRNGFFSDDDYFIVTTASDPLVPWFDQGWWGVPEGTAHCNITGSLYTHIAFPATLTVTAFGNNNGAAILQPDGHTLVYTQPLYVCTPGAPVLSIVDHKYGTGDIAGNGTWGGHGGSGLNAIGGTIRLGELMRGAPPMQHALKIELLAYQYYYGPAFGANRSTCFHWPAVQCDGYFNDCSPTSGYNCYNGSNPALGPGALLAIPPSQAQSVNASLATEPARSLLWTLVNYGGYLVDDTYDDRGTLCTEHGWTDAFLAEWGLAFNTRNSSDVWYQDMLALFRALHIVSNNGPSSQGGGGTSLQPLAPPLCP